MLQQALEPASTGGRSETDGVGSGNSSEPRLPNELLAQVVELACRSPPHPTSPRASASSEAHADSSSPRRTALDIQTTLSLAQVRDCHQMAVSILFAHIRTTRPSALQSLSETLAARPELGRLVKSLHLGPDDLMRDAKQQDLWWPQTIPILEMGMKSKGIAWFPASLTGPKDRLMVPRWCEGPLRFPLELPHRQRDCRFRAIVKALEAAQRAINVNVKSQKRAFVGGEISTPLWVMRTLEVQAALDLYLAAMRRLEEHSDDFQGSWRSRPAGPDEEVPYHCRKGRCGHYPTLDVVKELPHSDAAAEEATSSRSPLRLSRIQLLQHIFRTGALTDRFDHPLLALRSAAEFHRLQHTGRTGRRRHDRSLADQMEDFRPAFSTVQAGAVSYDGITIALPDEDALLVQARSILACTPTLSNLSFTGFLERRFPLPVLPALRAVSFGPPPPYFFRPLPLESPLLAKIEKLRICGVMLAESELRAIAQHLRRLEVVEWTMAEEFDNRHSISLEDTITALVEGLHRSSDPAPRLFRDDDESSVGEEDIQRDNNGSSSKTESKDSQRSPPPLIHVKLHPRDLANLLDRAPSPVIRDAWLSGESRPESGWYRLLLGESRAATRGGTRRTVVSVGDGWGVLYDEGRDWWDAEAQM